MAGITKNDETGAYLLEAFCREQPVVHSIDGLRPATRSFVLHQQSRLQPVKLEGFVLQANVELN